VLLPAWPQRSAPHEIRPAGEPCQGRGVPGDGQGTGSTACGQDSGVVMAPGTVIAPSRVGSAEPVPGRMRAGGPKVNSIAQGCPNLGRPHRYAVSPTRVKLHLAGGGGVRGRDAVTARRNLTPNCNGLQSKPTRPAISVFLGPHYVHLSPWSGPHYLHLSLQSSAWACNPSRQDHIICD
jgi:hypothetical protein